MPFPVAFWFWISAQSVALIGCWVWAWRRFGPEAAIWGALFFAGPLGIIHGQDGALFLAFLCGAFVLGERRECSSAAWFWGLG